jgi:hypothetical protein
VLEDFSRATAVTLAGLSLGFGSLVPVHAAIVHLPGTTVDFYYDDTQPGMAAYGTLGVIGDTIFATPGTFRAESNDGVGIHTSTPTDTFSAYGVVRVVAKAGYQFVGIDIGELGDYQMSAGSTASNASVGVTGWSEVYEWAGGGVFGQTQTENLVITGDFTDHSGQPVDWRGDASFDMTTSAWAGITDIGLGLQNNLTAFSDDVGVSAWIQKKAVAGAVGMEIMTTPIPVPAAVWLFGSGLLGLIGIARRK